MVFTVALIPTVANAASECTHSYDGICDTDCNLCGQVREAQPHVYGAWISVSETDSNGNLITGRQICQNCGATVDRYSTIVNIESSGSLNPESGFVMTPITGTGSIEYSENIHFVQIGDQLNTNSGFSENIYFDTAISEPSVSDNLLLSCFIGVIGLGIIWLGATFVIKAMRATANGTQDEESYESENFIED